MCSAEWKYGYQDSTIITSDDVFKYLFDIRSINEGIDFEKDRLMKEHTELENVRKYYKFFREHSNEFMNE